MDLVSFVAKVVILELTYRPLDQNETVESPSHWAIKSQEVVKQSALNEEPLNELTESRRKTSEMISRGDGGGTSWDGRQEVGSFSVIQATRRSQYLESRVGHVKRRHRMRAKV